MPVQNQHSRELVTAGKTSHKQQRLESPTVTLTWHASKYSSGESYHRQLGPLLLCLYDIFPTLINSLVC